jgi:4-amino-4-deoxychorismate lyase
MITASTQFTMINDVFVDRLEVRDRGLAFGDGLFETLLLSEGRAPLLGFHLDRLEEGCSRLSIPFSRAHIQSSLQRFLTALPQDASAVIKLIVTRGLGGQGYKPPAFEATSPSLIWQCSPLQDTSFLVQSGVELHLCRLPIYPNPYLAGLKHLNRLDYVMAAQELLMNPDAQGLLLDNKGNLLEAIHHNLFFIKDGILMTPRLSEAGVRGVLRRLLIHHLAPSCSFPVLEGDFSLDDLLLADEVFLTNAVRGVWPVKACRERRWDVPGTMTAQLQSLVADVFKGACTWG